MAEMRYVRDVMKSDVVTMSPTQNVIEAAHEMSSKNIGCIIVIERKKPIGIVTERDLVKKVLAKNKGNDIELRDVMTKDPLTLKPDTSIIDTARMMKRNRIRRFPIIEKGILVGVVTETDVLYGMNDMVRHLNWKLVNTKMAMEEFMDELTSLVL
ncbi:MAG: cyclic nucleotide-binding/CBS domain-containing protein [Candidatus Woesearchaeota archaeon]